MKLRENPAVKALAFTAAVAAFAATAILGWYQLANYDALWDPDYNEGDGYKMCIRDSPSPRSGGWTRGGSGSS